MTKQGGLPIYFQSYPHPALFMREGLVCERNAAAACLSQLPAPGQAAPDFLSGLELGGGRACVSCSLGGRLWEVDAAEEGGGLLAVFLSSLPLNPSEAETRLPLLLEQMRQHVGNLCAAIQLLTPAILEREDSKNKRYLATINQSHYRLMRLMNELECARNLSGDAPYYRPGPIDLAGFCRELSDRVSPLAGLTGIRFLYDSEVSSLLVTADARLLRNLLLCLLSNALQAAGPNGEAGLRLRRRGEGALVTVWDSGPGLAPGALDGPKEGAYRDGVGLGLGLSIARRIAALHGGALMLESRPGMGLRATLSLPPRKPEPAGTMRTPPPYDPNGGFSPELVELSSLLPYQAFFPDDLE